MEINYSTIKNNQSQMSTDVLQTPEGEARSPGAFFELLMNRITEESAPASVSIEHGSMEEDGSEFIPEELAHLPDLFKKIHEVILKAKETITSGQSELHPAGQDNPLVSPEEVEIIRDMLKEAIQVGGEGESAEGEHLLFVKAATELMGYFDKKTAGQGEPDELELDYLENILKEPLAVTKEMPEQKTGTALTLDKEQLVYPARQVNEFAVIDAAKLAETPVVGSSHTAGNIQEAPAIKSPVQPLAMPFEEFAAKMEEWINQQLNLSKGQIGQSEARFRLTPEQLGSIEVRLQFDEGRIHAEIITGTQMAKDALDSQLQQLRYNLQQQGLVIQKLDIIQQSIVPEATQTEMLLADQQQQQNSGEKQENPRVIAERAAEAIKEHDSGGIEVSKEHSAYLYPGKGALQAAAHIDFSI